jgi:aryl-alcohol dehydrogenase-like predicted oxidoreductase
MNTITLENGLKFSEIALGAGAMGSTDADTEKRVYGVMDRYAELGGFTFDSARLYANGKCDSALGKWLKTRNFRDKATVITKGSHPDSKTMHISRLSRDEIVSDIDLSLKEMGIEYSDIHIVHRDDVRKPVAEIIESLDYLVKSGRTRTIGVSNWTASRIAQANEYAESAGLTKILASQAQFSLAVTTAPATGDPTLVPINEVEMSWYKESQLALLAFGAQAKGWFAQRANGNLTKQWLKSSFDYFPENFSRLERLKKLSEETGKSITALTTAYVRDSGLRAIPLCAYSSIEQLNDSFGALDIKLTAAQIRFLESGT